MFSGMYKYFIFNDLLKCFITKVIIIVNEKKNAGIKIICLNTHIVLKGTQNFIKYFLIIMFGVNIFFPFM